MTLPPDKMPAAPEAKSADETKKILAALEAKLAERHEGCVSGMLMGPLSIRWHRAAEHIRTCAEDAIGCDTFDLARWSPTTAKAFSAWVGRDLPELDDFVCGDTCRVHPSTAGMVRIRLPRDGDMHWEPYGLHIRLPRLRRDVVAEVGDDAAHADGDTQPALRDADRDDLGENRRGDEDSRDAD